MKNAYVFLLIFAALQVCGQTEKGNSFIAGNFSTSFGTTLKKSNYNSKWRNTAVGLGLQYGKFVRDNVLWEINASENIVFSRNIVGRADDNRFRMTNSSFGIGTSGAYFFGKNQWRGFVGGGINVSLGFINNESKSSTTTLLTSKSSSVSAYPIFKAGAIYFMDSHWALQLATSSNSFPINFTGASLGLLYWVRPTSFRIEEATFSTLQNGNWVAGLDMGLSSLQQKDNNILGNNYRVRNKESNYRFGVKVGKFVKDKTVVGVRASVGFAKDNEEYVNVSGNFTRTEAQYSGGIFVKRYLANSRFTPYIESSLNFMRFNSTQKGSSTNSTYHTNTYQLGSSVGLAYLISNRFLVEAELAGLAIQYNSPFASQESLSVNLSSGLSPSFTLSYVF